MLVESRLVDQKRKEEEAAQRVIAETKAAEERGKAQLAAAQERERIAKENEEKRIQQANSIEEPEKVLRVVSMAEEAPQPEIATSGYASVVPGSFVPSKRTSDTIEEIVESFVDNGIEKWIALKVITLINNGKIKHVTINF